MINRTQLSLFGLAFLALVVLSCGDDGNQQVSPTEAATATAEATPTATPLKFTPLPGPDVKWQVSDPKFEALPGAKATFGTYEGSAYRIEVPDNWNGELVIWSHGYFGNLPNLFVMNPPIRDYLIKNGFAWAASSYRSNGYVPGQGAVDSLLLKELFTKTVGQPKRSYLYGQSMGGEVAAITAEFYPKEYNGILSECGVVAGVELFDFFAASAAAAQFITGVDVKTLAASAADPSTVTGAALSQMQATLGKVAEPTEKGKLLQNVIENLSGGPRPFFREGLAEQLLGGEMLYTDLSSGLGAFLPSENATAKAATNQDTRYKVDPSFALTSDAVNAGVPRKAADPAVRSRTAAYPELAPFTAKIEVPFLQIKTTGDAFVPIHLEQRYLAAAKAAGTTNLLVQRAIAAPGHCRFSLLERQRAFDDLVSWVRDGKKPAGDDLSGDLKDTGRQFTDTTTDALSKDRHP